MRPWRYDPHALARMDAREATYAEVEETLASPYATRPGRERRVHYFRAVDGFLIRVTVVPRIRLIVSVWKEPLS